MSATRMVTLAVLAAVMASAAASVCWSAERTISLESLLEEMVDREAAARFPDPAYTCRQASSYDRASVSPDDPHTWMANNDRSYFIRSEEHEGRTEWVMLDAAGPGCVVRFWATSGNPIGNIRIYIDGADQPVVNEPAKRLVGGDALVGPPLSEVCARGMNLYLPIPYAKQCKITYDRPNFYVTHNENDLLYYQINYRTYEADAKVESFSREVLAAAKEKIAKVQQTLLAPETVLPGNLKRLAPPARTLGPKESMSLEVAEANSVRKLAVLLKAEDLQAASRSTVLSMQCDGQQTIWCPVGDFFGSGVGVNPYRGWWRKVDKDGWMACYWVMPYQNSCRIQLENLGQGEVTVTAEVAAAPWSWDERSMYFHTNWRQEYPIDTRVKHDWNYIQVVGKGVYMGDTLALNNPVRDWWGEGDEKIYVDGERFPSHFGTGTEDYYGYAWGMPVFFQSPFHAQPRAQGPGSMGHVTNTRVRLLDGIPFTKDFRFDMEIWHWRQCEEAYAATTYWYGRPGAKANHGPAPEMARVIVAQPPEPPKVDGAIEGEGLKILEKTGGKTTVQHNRHSKWSGDRQLWWIDGKPGDKLVLAFTAEKAGSYQVTAALTKAIDYAVVRLSLDGQQVEEKLDLFNNGVVTVPLGLGTHQLAAGEHKLSVEISGANPRAIKRHMFGLDYLKLELAP